MFRIWTDAWPCEIDANAGIARRRGSHDEPAAEHILLVHDVPVAERETGQSEEMDLADVVHFGRGSVGRLPFQLLQIEERRDCHGSNGAGNVRSERVHDIPAGSTVRFDSMGCRSFIVWCHISGVRTAVPLPRDRMAAKRIAAILGDGVQRPRRLFVLILHGIPHEVDCRRKACQVPHVGQGLRLRCHGTVQRRHQPVHLLVAAVGRRQGFMNMCLFVLCVMNFLCQCGHFKNTTTTISASVM